MKYIDYTKGMSQTGLSRLEGLVHIAVEARQPMSDRVWALEVLAKDYWPYLLPQGRKELKAMRLQLELRAP